MLYPVKYRKKSLGINRCIVTNDYFLLLLLFILFSFLFLFYLFIYFLRFSVVLGGGLCRVY